MSKKSKYMKEDVWKGVAKSQHMRRTFESESEEEESPRAPIPPNKKSKLRG